MKEPCHARTGGTTEYKPVVNTRRNLLRMPSSPFRMEGWATSFSHLLPSYDSGHLCSANSTPVDLSKERGCECVNVYLCVLTSEQITWISVFSKQHIFCFIEWTRMSTCENLCVLTSEQMTWTYVFQQEAHPLLYRVNEDANVWIPNLCVLTSKQIKRTFVFSKQYIHCCIENVGANMWTPVFLRAN